MAPSLLPNGEQTFTDANGAPLAGGSVEFYVPGTLTPKDTWRDPGARVLNTNPVVLDGAGRAIIYGDGQYRQIVKDVLGNLVWDQLTTSNATLGVLLARNNLSDVADPATSLANLGGATRDPFETNLPFIPGTIDYAPALMALLAKGFDRIKIDGGTFPFSTVTISTPVELVFGPSAIISPIDSTVDPVFNVASDRVSFVGRGGIFQGHSSLEANTGHGAAIDIPLIANALVDLPNIWFGGAGYLNGQSGQFDFPVPGFGGTGGVVTFTVTNGVITDAHIKTGGAGYLSNVQTRLLFGPAGGIVPASVLVSVNEGDGSLILPTSGLGTVSCVVRSGGTGYLGGASGTLVYALTEAGGDGGEITFNVVNGVLISGLVTASGQNYVPNVAAIPAGPAWPAHWVTMSQFKRFTLKGTIADGGSCVASITQSSFVRIEDNEARNMATNTICFNLASCSNFWVMRNWAHDCFAKPHNGAAVRLTGDPNTQITDGVIGFNEISKMGGSNGIDSNCSAMRRLVYIGNQVTDCQGVQIQIKHGVGSVLALDQQGVKDVTFLGNVCQTSYDGTTIYHFQQNRKEPMEVQVDRSNVARHTSGNNNNTASVGALFISPQGGGPVSLGNLSPTVIDSTIGVKLVGQTEHIKCSPNCVRTRRGIASGGGVTSAIQAPDLSGASSKSTEYAAIFTGNPVGKLVINGANLTVEGSGLNFSTGASIVSGGTGYVDGTWPIYVAGGGQGAIVSVTATAGALSGTPSVLCSGHGYFGGANGTFTVKVQNPYYQDAAVVLGTLVLTVTAGAVTSAAIGVAGSGYAGLSGGALTWCPVLPENAKVTGLVSGGTFIQTSVLNGGWQFYDTTQTVTLDAGAGSGTGASFNVVLGISIGLQIGTAVGGSISNCLITGDQEAINPTAGLYGVEMTGNLLKSRTANSLLKIAGAQVLGDRNQLVSVAAPLTFTIASNAITIDRNMVRVKPSSGASDTLKNIFGAFLDGELISVTTDSDTDTITCDETGNMVLGGAPKVLDKIVDVLALQWRQDKQKWVLYSFQNNA